MQLNYRPHIKFYAGRFIICVYICWNIYLIFLSILHWIRQFQIYHVLHWHNISKIIIYPLTL